MPYLGECPPNVYFAFRSPQCRVLCLPCFFLLMVLVPITSNAADSQPVRLVFDTDMMGDVDDVGTVALLHALADKDEVTVLAMGLSGKNPWSPLCLDALNTYFRRPDIPIGMVRGPAFDKPSRYAEGIAKEFPARPEVRSGYPGYGGPLPRCPRHRARRVGCHGQRRATREFRQPAQVVPGQAQQP